MFFVKSELPQRRVRKMNPVKALVLDFIASDMDTAEVFHDGDYNNNNDMRHSLVNVIRDSKLPVKAMMINGRVFLVKKYGQDIQL